jgi:hypothetical protein
MDISVHDNVLVSYEVLCAQREIRFHTLCDGVQPIEHTDIIFRGVEGYYFYNDNLETIIFDVMEIPVEDILTDDKARFEEGCRFDWPGRWSRSDETRRAYLAEHGVRGFGLSSSYGMSGWVLAKSMEILQDERVD